MEKVYRASVICPMGLNKSTDSGVLRAAGVIRSHPKPSVNLEPPSRFPILTALNDSQCGRTAGQAVLAVGQSFDEGYL